MYRSFLAGLLLVFACTVAFAAVPEQISIQGRLTDASGNPLPAGPKTFTFKIFDATVGGTEIWPDGPGEDQVINTDAEGLWSATLGAVERFDNGQEFADTLAWLEIAVNDGITTTVLPRVRLVTNPYAFRVETVDGSEGGTISGILTVGFGNINPGAGWLLGINSEVTGALASVTGGQYNFARGDYSHIGGGGGSDPSDSNSASGRHSTIGGGSLNLASGRNSVIGGGHGNIGSGFSSSVLGGNDNFCTGDASTIGGGVSSLATGRHAFIGGGFENQAITDSAAIGGGSHNVASGVSSVIAGGGSNHTQGSFSVIGGGRGNNASADSTTIAGGVRNTASQSEATVGGGRDNTASGFGATVAGGRENSALGRETAIGGGDGNTASGPNVTIAGGEFNSASGYGTVIAGGTDNVATGEHAAIGGGRNNVADDTASIVVGGGNNRARGAYAFVGGGGGANPGDSNSASGVHSVIMGGKGNAASGEGALICGGAFHTASGAWTVIGGGFDCDAINIYGTVAGGHWNNATGLVATIGGGEANVAGGTFAVIGGGNQNSVSGNWAVVPGGRDNTASAPYSFAAGRRASALHNGAFVWADPSDVEFASTNGHQFLIRASGGVGIGTNAPEGPLHVFEASAGAMTANSASTAVFERDATNYISVLSPDNTDRGILFGSPLNSACGAILFDTPTFDNGFEFRANTNDTRMTLDATGNLTATGCVVGSNIACPSDERFKRNIKTLPDALDAIEKLRGVTYEWKSNEFADRDFPEGQQVGLIAQEVRDVVPQAVIEQSDGYLAVDYARLVPLLIEGMKEQQKQIESQNRKIARLEEKLAQ